MALNCYIPTCLSVWEPDLREPSNNNPLNDFINNNPKSLIKGTHQIHRVYSLRQTFWQSYFRKAIGLPSTFSWFT